MARWEEERYTHDMITLLKVRRRVRMIRHRNERAEMQFYNATFEFRVPARDYIENFA